MKKYYFLIILALILGLVLTGCSLLSNVGQVPATEQSGVTYLTKGGLLPNLVGLWSFDEGEKLTIAYDSSGNNNYGEIYGANYTPDQWGGQALSFNGVDNYVKVPIIPVTNGLTLEAWVYYEGGQIPETNYGGIISNVDGRGNRNRLLLRGAKTVLWQTIIGGATNNHFFTLPGDQRNAWHHYALTYDGANVSLFWDGNQVGTDQSITGDLDSGIVEPTIGWGSTNPDYYHLKGLIDEVRIYDYALSSDTIENHAVGNYGFNGLIDPYAPPEEKTFKFGRTIPLKWQYTDFGGNVVDSVDANPVVKCQFVDTGNGVGELELTEYPGSSGLRYDNDTKTWQFNWQTKGLSTGSGKYNIWIASNLTGQVNGPFLIELR